MSINKIKSRQIEAFRGFMLTGSVTLAAEFLCISQPAVSKLLADLEYRLGFTLFVRYRNKLTATPEAYLFYEEVKNVFIGMERLEKAADNISRNNKGQLRIGMLPICSDSFMIDVLANYMQLYPDVAIEVETASSSQLIDMLKKQQVDLAILTRVDDPELCCQLLFRQHAVVILWDTHSLSQKTQLTAQDVKFERFMTLGYGSPFRTRVEDCFVKEGIKRHIILEAREQQTLCQLVRKQAGIAILDPLVIYNIKEGIITRPFSPDISWGYHMVTPKNSPLSGLVSAFQAVLIQFIERHVTK